MMDNWEIKRTMTPPTLNLTDDAAFLRGVEMADAATVEAFIAALRKIREPNRYANQDVDKRMDARLTLATLRTIGNTPLKRGV